MTFQRVSTLKNWVIGSIESDTGSEYLFGFDPAVGLMWLERSGVEYGPQDAVWGQAEGYVHQSVVKPASLRDMMSEGAPSTDPEEQYVVQAASVSSDDRPATVTRSLMGTAPDDYDMPTPGDPRIVGDLSEDGRDFSEEDLATQASEFLANLGEE